MYNYLHAIGMAIYGMAWHGMAICLWSDSGTTTTTIAYVRQLTDTVECPDIYSQCSDDGELE